MAKVTFDGPNRLIIVNSGETSLDAEVDLYSDWKEWVLLSDNAKFFPAFRTVAGDPVSLTKSLSGHFFLQNQVQPNGGTGWRIRPPEEDIEIVIDGNLWLEDTTVAGLVPTLGAYTTQITVERSADSLTTGSADPNDIAAAVWDKDSSTYDGSTDSFGDLLVSIPSLVFNKLFGPLLGAK
jgi:hypothetical protein